MIKVQSDFSPKEPCINRCTFSIDNKFLVSGGKDTIVRVFQVNTKAFNQIEGNIELKGAAGEITDVDMSVDNRLVVGSSRDA